MDDRELVKICLHEVFEKMGYAEDRKLSHSDLEHLCYLVEEKSRIVISLSTMKRIFQGRFERLPQISTLDALTIFLGYPGWQDFKSKKSVTEIRKPVKTSYASYLAAVSLIAVGIVALLLWRTYSETENANDVTFSVKKIVSESIPKNVIFEYNIDNVEGDSFFLQPTWNQRIKVRIRKSNHTQTETYFEPGYHTAKLICDGRVLKTVAVHIPTANWIGFAKTNFFDMHPEYFKNEHVTRDHVLGIDEKGLEASQLTFDKNKIYYFTHFPDSLNVSGDDFTLKARMRMKNVGNSLCPWMIAEAISERGFLYFMGTTPGCTSEINANFFDKHLDGKTTDLSSFGLDVTEWNDLRMEVKGKTVSVYINNQKVFTDVYKSQGGPIHGMGFGSNGLCEVDFVELIDAHGRIVYSDDFEHSVALR